MLVYSCEVFSQLLYSTLCIGLLLLESLQKFQNFEYARHKTKISLTILVIVACCANIITVFYSYAQIYACYSDMVYYHLPVMSNS